MYPTTLSEATSSHQSLMTRINYKIMKKLIIVALTALGLVACNQAPKEPQGLFVGLSEEEQVLFQNEIGITPEKYGLPDNYEVFDKGILFVFKLHDTTTMEDWHTYDLTALKINYQPSVPTCNYDALQVSQIRQVLLSSEKRGKWDLQGGYFDLGSDIAAIYSFYNDSHFSLALLVGNQKETGIQEFKDLLAKDFPEQEYGVTEAASWWLTVKWAQKQVPLCQYAFNTQLSNGTKIRVACPVAKKETYMIAR
jgi:hypothetical protein